MKTKLLLVGIWMVVLAACTKKEETQVAEEAEVTEWAEMDSFHMIMAEALYHFKVSANRETVELIAEELAAEAEKWTTAALPANVDTDEVKALLTKLKTDTRALADKVKAGVPNEELGTDLTALHDNFHGIMEAWNKSRGEKHEHQH